MRRLPEILIAARPSNDINSSFNTVSLVWRWTYRLILADSKVAEAGMNVPLGSWCGSLHNPRQAHAESSGLHDRAVTRLGRACHRCRRGWRARRGRRCAMVRWRNFNRSQAAFARVEHMDRIRSSLGGTVWD